MSGSPIEVDEQANICSGSCTKAELPGRNGLNLRSIRLQVNLAQLSRRLRLNNSRRHMLENRLALAGPLIGSASELQFLMTFGRSTTSNSTGIQILRA